MQKYKKMPKEYDVAIIGSDISGIILAQILSTQHDLKVAVISSKQSLEDFRIEASEAQQKLHEEFNYYPSNEDSEDLLSWLEESILEQKVHSKESHSQIPVTFDSGQFKDFLGFGDRKLKTLEALEYYLSQNQSALTLSPQEWVNLILKDFKAEILPMTYVTNVEVEEGRINSIVINESQALVADKFIFTGSPKDLIELIPNDQIIGKAKQKIAKAELWARVNLTIVYDEEFEHKEGMHVLMGSSDEFEPVVGQFKKTTLGSEADEDPKCSLSSHWTYLLDHENYDDPDSLGAAVKYMKRQIKRAYPDSFDMVDSERISVFRDTHGQVSYDGKISKTLSNLYVASPHFSPQKGLVGSLAQARLVYDGFFSPQE